MNIFSNSKPKDKKQKRKYVNHGIDYAHSQVNEEISEWCVDQNQSPRRTPLKRTEKLLMERTWTPEKKEELTKKHERETERKAR